MSSQSEDKKKSLPLKIKIRSLKNCCQIREGDKLTDETSYEVLNNYIGYMRSIGCISKFCFYQSKPENPLPHDCSYIIVARTLYGKPKTRVYHCRGDSQQQQGGGGEGEEDNLFEVIVKRALDNLMRSNLMFYWRNYLADPIYRKLYQDLVKVEVRFNKLNYYLNAVGLIDEYPTCDIAVVRGKKYPPGTRVAKISYILCDSGKVSTYRGSIVHIDYKNKQSEIVLITQSKIRAMKRCISYMNKYITF
jgi:hypothetical protein